MSSRQRRNPQSASLLLGSRRRKKKSHKDKLEKFIAKPGEEKDYHPVAEAEDTRTYAEKRFDERLKKKVGETNSIHL